MFAPLVCLAALSIPTPTDLLVADAVLHAPVGSDGPPASGRMRVAVLAVMLRVGACDPDVTGQWFTPQLAWASEVDHARRMVAEVATCPPLAEDKLPPGAWYAAEAARLGRLAGWHRDRAREYRDRIPWEAEYEARLLAWVVWHEAHADALSCAAERAGLMAGRSWQRPRRVVLRMSRE